MFSDSEAEEVYWALLSRYEVLTESMNATKDLVDVHAHWKTKRDAVESAYNKMQTIVLRINAEKLRKQMSR